MSYLTGKILKEFDESLLTGIIIVGLEKAFDTINHKVLCHKNQKHSICRNKFFSPNRGIEYYFVETVNKISDFRNIFGGVPQGSILGSLLFLSYVINIPQGAILKF